jgi:hypothetical protein
MTVFNYAEFHLKVRTNIVPNDATDAFFEKVHMLTYLCMYIIRFI